MRGPDVRLVKIGIAVAFLVAPVVWLAGGGEFSMVVFEVFMGLVLAAPIATRMAGWVLAEGIVTLELFVATALLLAAYTYALPQVSAEFRPLLGAATVIAMLAVATTDSVSCAQPSGGCWGSGSEAARISSSSCRTSHPTSASSSASPSARRARPVAPDSRRRHRLR